MVVRQFPTPAERPAPRRLAAEISPKLAAAEQRLADMEGQYGPTALAATLGEQGAPEKLARLQTLTQASRDACEQLRAAHKQAIEQDATADREAKAKLRASQFAAMSAHGRERLAAMIELSGALEVAAAAHKRFHAATERMAAALPIGSVLPSGALIGADAIVRGELFRNSAGGPPGDLLPGARSPSHEFALQPERIEPAAEVIRRQNDWVLGTIKRQLDAGNKVAPAEHGAGA